MKVLYDYQIFNNQNFGGISRYFYELFKAYKCDEDVTFELPIKYSSNTYIKNSNEFPKDMAKGIDTSHFENFLKGFNFKGKFKLYQLKHKILNTKPLTDIDVNKELTIQRLKEGNFDIFHPTYYDDYFLEFIGKKPYVITVYDMIHQIFPEYFLWGGVDKNRNLLCNASQVIAISECTKRDLINFYNIDEQKIKITHLANSLIPTDSQVNIEFVSQLPKNYLLFVGSRNSYKNFYFLLQAFSIISEEYNDLHVVCTGSSFEKYEIEYFRKLRIENKISQYYIDDSKLAILYQNANIFIFPSLYEGFGIPVLEGFACGCAVINSNAGSLPEIGGDAAIYFEPKNIASLIAALRQLLSNNDLKKNMIKKGYEQLQKFSWEQTAKQTKDIYKQVLFQIN